MASSAPKVGLLLRAWDTIPEIVGSTVVAIIGFGMGVSSLWLYDKKNGDHKKYKFQYVVYRPDDPRVANIRKHSNLDD